MFPDQDLRADLRLLLERGRTLHEKLIRLAARPQATTAEITDQINLLERLDDERDAIVRELQAEANRDARRSGTRTRQALLDALEQIGHPQTVSFLRECIWARDRITFPTRSFAYLRRDERRAWERNPEGRAAYLAPALDPDGHPVQGWLTRSDWPLSRRIVPAGKEYERRLALEGIAAVLRENAQRRDPGTASPFDGTLARLGKEHLGLAPPSDTGGEAVRRWRRTLGSGVRRELDRSPPFSDERAIARLERLPVVERLWGRQAVHRGAGRGAGGPVGGDQGSR